MLLRHHLRAVPAVLVILLVGLWAIAHPGPSHACSCIEPGSPSEALERSAVVFSGRVVAIDDRLVLGSSLDPLIVEFEVETVWKGPLHPKAELKTANDSASCGYSFVEGGEYLVYSRNGSEASLCSRTRPLSKAGDDLSELGPGQTVPQSEPDPTYASPEAPPGGGCGPSAGGDELLLAGVVVGLAWLGLGKRRPTKRS